MIQISAKKKQYYGLGLMSGSSLDGLDIALCEFHLNHETEDLDHLLHDWKILKAHTVEYPKEWLDILTQLEESNSFDFFLQHVHYGKWCADQVNSFLESLNIQPDFIASHGHTIHHAPDQGITVQLGCGATIAANCNIPVVNDFRVMDVAFGGEGAPLAPMADKLLIDKKYDFFLNLGGIANISVKKEKELFAYDICGANQTLNALSQLLDLPYDKAGKMAASGQFNTNLFQEAIALPYFQFPYPKSLSNEWVRENQTAIFLQHPSKIEDRLHTACQLIAQLTANEIEQLIRKELSPKTTYQLIATGGGAYNTFLMESIRMACKDLPVEIAVPAPELVEFKEAALMSLIGLLRLLNLPNSLSSATGASRDAIGGVIHKI